MHYAFGLSVSSDSSGAYYRSGAVGHALQVNCCRSSATGELLQVGHCRPGVMEQDYRSGAAGQELQVKHNKSGVIGPAL